MSLTPAEQGCLKNVENQENWPKNIQKCTSYCKIPTQDKKGWTYTQNPTAGPQTYWAAYD